MFLATTMEVSSKEKVLWISLECTINNAMFWIVGGSQTQFLYTFGDEVWASIRGSSSFSYNTG